MLKILLLLLFAITATASQDPSTMIKNTGDKLINTISIKKQYLKQNPQELYKVIDDIVMPVVDFSRFSRLVLKNHWKQATKTQKETFSVEFRKMLLKTYGAVLIDNVDKLKIQYLNTQYHPEINRLAVVNTEIILQGENPVPVSYQVYLNNQGQWRCYNVIAGEINIGVTFQNAFADTIETEGLQGFLNELVAKNKGQTSKLDGLELHQK